MTKVRTIKATDPHRLWSRHSAKFRRVLAQRELLEERTEPQVSVQVVRGRLRITYGPEPELRDFPAFPDALRGLTCGARTRAGTRASGSIC